MTTSFARDLSLFFGASCPAADTGAIGHRTRFLFFFGGLGLRGCGGAFLLSRSTASFLSWVGGLVGGRLVGGRLVGRGFVRFVRCRLVGDRFVGGHLVGGGLAGGGLGGGGLLFSRGRLLLRRWGLLGGGGSSSTGHFLGTTSTDLGFLGRFFFGRLVLGGTLVAGVLVLIAVGGRLLFIGLVVGLVLNFDFAQFLHDVVAGPRHVNCRTVRLGFALDGVAALGRDGDFALGLLLRHDARRLASTVAPGH